MFQVTRCRLNERHVLFPYFLFLLSQDRAPKYSQEHLCVYPYTATRKPTSSLTPKWIGYTHPYCHSTLNFQFLKKKEGKFLFSLRENIIITYAFIFQSCSSLWHNHYHPTRLTLSHATLHNRKRKYDNDNTILCTYAGMHVAHFFTQNMQILVA